MLFGKDFLEEGGLDQFKVSTRKSWAPVGEEDVERRVQQDGAHDKISETRISGERVVECQGW